MNPEELIQEDNNLDIEICEECNGEINCKKDNIYKDIYIYNIIYK